MGCCQSTESIDSNNTTNPANSSAATREETASQHLQARKGAKRNNVINVTDLEEKFDAPVYEKTKAQEDIIRECITGPDAFFFTDVDDSDVATLGKCFFLLSFFRTNCILHAMMMYRRDLLHFIYTHF
jgi:hypothetical protein